MQSPYYFIVKPIGSEYNNEIQIAGQQVIVNSTVENHEHVNRYAEIIYVPQRHKGEISKGDSVIVHHNIFRIYYDMKGNPKKSPNYFKDGLYFIDEFQFYLYNNGKQWNAVGDNCFVRPITKEDTYLYEDSLEDNTGVVAYDNLNLNKLGVFKGDKVNFRKNSEYKFTVGDEVLYRMKTNDICAIL
ncbi:MAG: hypothetical protein GOVbin3171_43 [Prokaryotic dsDNA virus sp.]|nr:MAG: hypothetical protein GOVbin3171_43 [Prokaryotic dsDNA virus sp.]